METTDQLPFVVHLDDADEPADVLDALALESFVAGRHPIARSQHLSRVRSEATLLPQGSSRCRSAQAQGRTVMLSEGPGWTLKVTRWRDNTATLIVTATRQDLADTVLREVSAGATESRPASGPNVPVGFWHWGSRGAQRSVRTIDVTPWVSIRSNYTASAAIALDELVALSAQKLTGRLLLLHGPPGTGKTSVVRALAYEWREWCDTDCILDPELLLRDAGYLTSVLLGNSEEDNGERSHRWRLLVLEDCDEVVRCEAKAGVGQALSRLLNLTDGLLGQGRKVLICITTNEDLSRFHPAVVRPGRCLKQIEIGPLSSEEAAAWLGVSATKGPTALTLADLYALRGGYLPSPAGPDHPIGQYL